MGRNEEAKGWTAPTVEDDAGRKAAGADGGERFVRRRDGHSLVRKTPGGGPSVETKKIAGPPGAKRRDGHRSGGRLSARQAKSLIQTVRRVTPTMREARREGRISAEAWKSFLRLVAEIEQAVGAKIEQRRRR